MKKIMQVLTALFTPLMVVIGAIRDLAGAVIELVAVLPATLLSSLVSRLKGKVDSFEDQADRKQVIRDRRLNEKAINTAVTRLLCSQDYMSHAKSSAYVKTLIIIALEVVSLPTTYRGLVQCFTTMGPWIPIVLAGVIQVGLAFLANGAFSNYAPKAHRWMVCIFLAFSIFFSYLGVAESLLGYENHIANEYNLYKASWETIYEQATDENDHYANPHAKLVAQRDTAKSILIAVIDNSDADDQAQLENKIAELKSRTITVTKTSSLYPVKNAEGEVIGTAGGATTIEEVADPDAQKAAIDVGDQLYALKKQNKYATELLERLNDDFSEDKLKETLDKQLSVESGEVTPDFTTMCLSLTGFASECNTLAEQSGSALRVTFDLESLLGNYRQFHTVDQVPVLLEFSALKAELENDITPTTDGGTGIYGAHSSVSDLTVWEYILTPFLKDNPSDVLEVARGAVESSYVSLKAALMKVQEDKLLSQLETAYAVFSPTHPFYYMLQPLLSNHSNTFLAILSLIIALAIDGTAVLTGAFFSYRGPNWFRKRSFTKGDLAPYSYTQFRSVILPMITERLGSKAATRSSIYHVFSVILSNFLDKFEIIYSLKGEGFCRAALLSTLNDRESKQLVSFLQSVGMAEIIDCNMAVELGVIHTTSSNEDSIVLLCTRGNSWLCELIGKAAEITTDPVPAVSC